TRARSTRLAGTSRAAEAASDGGRPSPPQRWPASCASWWDEAMKPSPLADGEEIQADLRTHWKALVGPIIVLVVAVVALRGVAAFGEGTSWGRWALLVVPVLAVLLVWLATVLPVWRWSATHYVFTNRRISHRYGLLTKKG